MLSLLSLLALGNPSSGYAQQVPQVLRNHVRPVVTTGQAPVVGALPPDKQLNVSIVLPLRHADELSSLLQRLYDPASPDYRRFLSVDQFTEKFGPTAEDYQALVAFARAEGFVVTGTPANRLVVPVRATVDQINKAFHLSMTVYRHPVEDRTFFSPDREPTLDLAVPVAHIAGLNNYSIPRPMVEKSQQGVMTPDVTGSGPSGSYLASDMRAAYYGGTTLDGNGQSVGLVEFGGYYLGDVEATFSTAGQAYTVPINNVLLDGASSYPLPDEEDAEQVLDIVQAIGMAPGLSQVRVYIGAGEDDANVLNSMASDNIAKSLSCSWGWLPEDPSTDDVFFKEFAAQGQSFLSASGDNGAFDIALNPYFYPSEDDYVTSVGGTHLTTSGPAGSWVSEVAWNSGGAGSGGGISPDGIVLPSWQAGIATAANGGSTTLRNEPDVAMEGDFDNYVCALGDCAVGWAGTSFAAPRWAGFLALVNQQAVEAGNAPAGGVGFVNPAIYAIGNGTSYSKDLHDIVSGNNDTQGQPTYFNAVPGYDLVTGWGSASGQSLIDDLAGKQVPGFWIGVSPPTVPVLQGASTSTTITITGADGFSGSVSLAVSSTLPSGVTASWSTNPTTGSSVLTFKASATATTGPSVLTITGTSGKLTAITKVTLVVEGPTFALSPSPSSVLLNPGGSATSAITLTPEFGFKGSANLSISGLPNGVSASFSTNPITTQSVLTLSASAAAKLGSYNVTITGTSGSLTVTTPLSLLVAVPTFSLVTQPSVSMGQGSSFNSYVDVLGENGFNSPVNLSITGLPNGVTASFSPNPTSGSSTLNLTTSSTASLGTSTVTITGTSGSLTEKTTLMLNILAPAFAISNPGTAILGQGTSSNLPLFVNPEYGFTGNVTLAISGLPSGVTASFSPNPTANNTQLTLTASGTAPLGTSTVTITGTSGKLSSSTTFPLEIFTPTFTISAPGGISLGQGTSNTASFSVVPEYGFSGFVSLSASGLPSGVTASFSPNPSPGFTMLTLTASSTVALGASTVTITGTSGKMESSVTFPFSVFAPAFTVSGPASLSIGQGNSTTATVQVSPEYGFTGSALLTASGLPSGMTASFSPNPTSGQSQLTLTANNSSPLGVHTITVTGTFGKQTATTTIPLTTYAPTFTLYSPGGASLSPGSSVTAYLSINPEYGFTGSVNLAVSGLPAGVTAGFLPNPTSGTTTLTLSASSSAVAATSTLTITGTSGTQTATTTLPLTIEAPTFSIYGPGSVSMSPGTSVPSNVSINAQNGFTGAVKLSVAGLPSGVTASFSPNPATGQSILTLTASSAVALGAATLTINGTSGSLSSSSTISLNIGAPNLTISSPGNITIGQGTITTLSVYTSSTNGITCGVNLSATGLPGGVTASFSPNPSTGQATLTLAARGTAAVGLKTVTIAGTCGKVTASTTFALSVVTPNFTLSDYGSATLLPGTSTVNYLYVNPQYGFTGTVNLSASGLPRGVTASFSPNPSTGQAELTLTASSSAAVGTYTITINGVSGSQTASTTLSMSIVDATFTLNYNGPTALTPGTAISSTVYVNTQNGFNGSVNFSISGLPSGVTASFSPTSSASSTVLRLTASPSAPATNATLTLTGVSGNQKVTVPTALSVIPPSFTLSAGGAGTLSLGGTASSYVNVSSVDGFSGNVKLAVTGLPSGVTGSFTPNPTMYGNSQLTLQASNSASVGEYTVTVTGTFGAVTSSTTFPLTIAAPSFSFGSGFNFSVGQGTSTSSYLYINAMNGFTGNIKFAVSGLPNGVSGSFSPNPATYSTSYNTMLTLTASSTATLGQYTAVITGTSGTQTSSSTLMVGVYAPSFSIYGYGGSIGQGSSITNYVSINPQYGFTGAVNLTLSGLPSGVTASFSPNPTSSGSSALTLQASNTATLGNFNLTITGTSGSQTASTVIPLTVYPPTFILYDSGGVSLGQGTSTTTYVSAQGQYGFAGSVQLAISGLPGGVSASFSPNPVVAGSSSSVLTLQATSSAKVGIYSATITGVSGKQTVSTTFPITIAAPSFSLYSGANPVLGQGTTATDFIEINPQNGFTGNVTLAVSGLPSGVSASFSPNPTNQSSTITFTASGNAALGEYNVFVTGTSGAQTSSIYFPITIVVPTFTLSYQSPAYLGQGTITTTNVEIYPQYGFTGNVTFGVSGLPSGVTASFSPNPANQSTTLTLNATSTAPLGNYNLSISGTSGTQTSTTTFPITVVTPTFTFSSSGVSVNQGGSGGEYVYLYPQYGFSGNVTLVASGLPAGITASFSPNPVALTATSWGLGSQLTLTASASAPVGSHTFTISGSSGTLSASASSSVNVLLNNVTATLTPASLTFPSTAVGASSAAQTLTLTNTSSVAMQLDSVHITGADASSFLQSGTNCPGSLAAGASCTISIECKPVSTGTLTASYNLNDSAGSSPQTVSLSGVGTPDITATLTPATLTFPTTAVGSTSAAQLLTLTNTSDTTINLGGVHITGTDASSFLQSGTTCPSILAAAASCTISIECKPAASGTLTATYSLTDTAANSPQTVALSGVGNP